MFIQFEFPSVLRVYTKEFGFNLVEAAAQHRPSPTLRQKVRVDPKKTDVEISRSLPLGDTWSDASLVSVYRYLRSGVVPPDTWLDAMAQFDSELAAQGLL